MSAIAEHPTAQDTLSRTEQVEEWFRFSRPGDCVRVSTSVYCSCSVVLKVANAIAVDRRWERRSTGDLRWLVCIEPGGRE